jgi:hypothetical protein
MPRPDAPAGNPLEVCKACTGTALTVADAIAPLIILEIAAAPICELCFVAAFCCERSVLESLLGAGVGVGDGDGEGVEAATHDQLTSVVTPELMKPVLAPFGPKVPLSAVQPGDARASCGRQQAAIKVDAPRASLRPTLPILRVLRLEVRGAPIRPPLWRAS